MNEMTKSITHLLSTEEIAEIDAEILHIPKRSGAAIDALKIVQSHRGWVSDRSIKAIAEHLQMPAAELDGIATFYSLIFRKPVGKKVILLCNSISCWITGCDRLQQKITDQLGIGLGETTADNEYTLIPASCLGACDKAPVLILGDELHENINEATIEVLFKNPKNNSGAGK